MRTFNYSAIKEQKWDLDVLGLIAAIVQRLSRYRQGIYPKSPAETHSPYPKKYCFISETPPSLSQNHS